jgi:hypothetical protein
MMHSVAESKEFIPIVHAVHRIGADGAITVKHYPELLGCDAGVE